MIELELKEVKWHPKDKRIVQIPKEGLEFAMLSKNYEQINQLVWCKDFMQDIIWSHCNQEAINIYGFSYDPNKDPSPSLSTLKLLVTNFKDHELQEKLMTRALPFIHSIENKLQIPLTTLEKCKSPPPTYKKSGVWILNANKRWLKCTPMLSFYTLLVRIGLVHNPGDSYETTLSNIRSGKVETYYDPRKRDQRLLEDCMPAINRILSFSDKKLFCTNLKDNYSKNPTGKRNIYIDTIHNSCGIAGYSKGKTDDVFPEWTKKRKLVEDKIIKRANAIQAKIEKLQIKKNDLLSKIKT